MGRECGTHGSGKEYVQSFGRKPEEKMGWVGNVACTGMESNTYIVSVEKPEDKMSWAGNVARMGM
jgi:hypothetical protein